MKILFTRFPLESRYGGAEVQTMSLLRGLPARGHTAAFLGSCPTLLQLCREEGIPAAELRIGPPPVSLLHAASFPFRKSLMKAKLLMAVEGFHGIDAVCMLSLSEKILLTPHLLRRGIRVIWIEHDRVGRWLEKNPWLPKLRELAHSVTTVVVSDLSRELYLRLGWPAERVISIPNGIDCAAFPTKPATCNLQPATFLIGTLSRLTPDKGIDLLIDAVAELPAAELTIVGSGSDEGLLRSKAGELAQREGVERIHIRSWIDDIPAFLSETDAFVLPSREHDPFGIAAAEAMAAGVPTIVTDACGISRHLTADRDALVVPAGDAGALRDALDALMRNAGLRAALSESGVRHARATFDLQGMIDRYEQLLRGA